MAKKKSKPKAVIEDSGRIINIDGISMDQFMTPEEAQRLKEQVAREFDMTRYPDRTFSQSDEQIRIIQTAVSGLTLDFGTRKYNDMIKWGAHISDSEIRLHNPKKCHLFCSTLERCRLVAVHPQVESNWGSMHWIDCQFEGIFRSCRFGRTSGDRCFQQPLARMERCDFSKAQLDACHFLNTDPKQVVWPESPHVIVLEPWQHVEAILAIHPALPLQRLLQNIALTDESLSALALSLEWVQGREWLSAPDIERFISACRSLDFVILNF